MKSLRFQLFTVVFLLTFAVFSGTAFAQKESSSDKMVSNLFPPAPAATTVKESKTPHLGKISIAMDVRSMKKGSSYGATMLFGGGRVGGEVNLESSKASGTRTWNSTSLGGTYDGRSYNETSSSKSQFLTGGVVVRPIIAMHKRLLFDIPVGGGIVSTRSQNTIIMTLAADSPFLPRPGTITTSTLKAGPQDPQYSTSTSLTPLGYMGGRMIFMIAPHVGVKTDVRQYVIKDSSTAKGYTLDNRSFGGGLLVSF